MISSKMIIKKSLKLLFFIVIAGITFQISLNHSNSITKSLNRFRNNQFAKIISSLPGGTSSIVINAVPDSQMTLSQTTDYYKTQMNDFEEIVTEALDTNVW